MGGGCGSFFSACLLGACGVSHFSGCQDKTEPLFLASRRAVLGFIMKVMKLKLHSPSFTGTASTALGGTTATWLHDHTFWLNLKVTYLFSFSFPQLRFQAPQNPDPLLYTVFWTWSGCSVSPAHTVVGRVSGGGGAGRMAPPLEALHPLLGGCACWPRCSPQQGFFPSPAPFFSIPHLLM